MHYPENTRQVEAIIQNARKIKTPLVARSSRGPHLHGASENPIAETVDFSCMNRIIKIDRRSRYVRVEPGVTFGELIPLLKDAGMRLNMPLLPRAGKSVRQCAGAGGGSDSKIRLHRPALTVSRIRHGDVSDGFGSLFRKSGGNPRRHGLALGPGLCRLSPLFTGAQGTRGSSHTLKRRFCPLKAVFRAGGERREVDLPCQYPFAAAHP